VISSLSVSTNDKKTKPNRKFYFQKLSNLLVNSYTPSAGVTFTILDAASLLGTFTTTNLPTLPSGLSWSTSYNGSAGTVILTVTGVLPVELLRFSATPTLSAVNLDWSTALEQNTKDFTLKRSRDGKDFTPLSKTDAKGFFIELSISQ
jgi:hypothetical protein